MTFAPICEILDYLNLIHHTSYTCDIDNTQEVISKSISLIQYKYLRSSEFVTLREEILQYETFLEIIRRRFGSKIEIINKIYDSTLDTFIPNYSIMTFVENAIFHGLVSKDGDWKLTLEVEDNDNDNYIRIVITDNGVGFNTSSLIDKDYLTDEVGTIQYISNQLKTLYHGLGELQITSSSDNGTQVNILIPKI